MNIPSINDLDLNGKRVLVRVDFNVPLKDSGAGSKIVTDDTRIQAALPTIRKILDENGTPILMSHLGRPKGGPDPQFSLAPVARHLGRILNRPVLFVPHTVGSEAQEAVDFIPAGGVLVLENTRFLSGETKNEDETAEQMAQLADVYINDAFGSAHRAHASTEGVARKMETTGMGYLLAKEVNYLSKVQHDPEHPFVGIIGGAKVSDKIGVIQSLLEKVDFLLIGGAMSYTFLKALGRSVGNSLVEDDKLDVAMDLLNEADGRIKLPTDHIAADAFDNNAKTQTVSGDIPDGFMGLDIGPDTVSAYHKLLLDARTVVWNGPMGVFEMSNFANGTLAIAKTLAQVTSKGALTIVGGGDSVAAITQAGLDDEVSHVSTGGGAMLEFLEGKTLPGVAVLK